MSILAGPAAAEGKAGARPQDQVQLAVHRQREVSLHEEVLPCRLPRHKALGLKYYVNSQKTRNDRWKHELDCECEHFEDYLKFPKRDGINTAMLQWEHFVSL